jgi:hypothetical protein
VDPNKIQANQDWSEPQSAQDLRSFLGLANYFKKFIAGFSTIAAPLIELTSPRTTYTFSAPARKAFTALKHALTHAPVLAFPDDSKPYELVSDTSGFACGAVLLQEGRPVAFYTYKMNAAEKNYHAGEQELLAVVKALEHWRHYLEGAVSLTIVTDHKPNITLDTKAQQTPSSLAAIPLSLPFYLGMA